MIHKQVVIHLFDSQDSGPADRWIWYRRCICQRPAAAAAQTSAAAAAANKEGQPPLVLQGDIMQDCSSSYFTEELLRKFLEGGGEIRQYL